MSINLHYCAICAHKLREQSDNLFRKYMTICDKYIVSNHFKKYCTFVDFDDPDINYLEINKYLISTEFGERSIMVIPQGIEHVDSHNILICPGKHEESLQQVKDLIREQKTANGENL